MLSSLPSGRNPTGSRHPQWTRSRTRRGRLPPFAGVARREQERRPALGEADYGRPFRPGRSITARRSSTRASKVGNAVVRSESRVPCLSNRTSRGERRQPAEEASLLDLSPCALQGRTAPIPSTNMRSKGPSPTVAYAMLDVPALGETAIGSIHGPSVDDRPRDGNAHAAPPKARTRCARAGSTGLEAPYLPPNADSVIRVSQQVGVGGDSRPSATFLPGAASGSHGPRPVQLVVTPSALAASRSSVLKASATGRSTAKQTTFTSAAIARPLRRIPHGQADRGHASLRLVCPAKTVVMHG